MKIVPMAMAAGAPMLAAGAAFGGQAPLVLKVTALSAVRTATDRSVLTQSNIIVRRARKIGETVEGSCPTRD